MKITVLIENKADNKLSKEHGLAILIEYNNKNYLLDTGASDLFLGNADKLGVDLSKVTAAVLSHSHYDHSGGYAAFFSRNSKAKVYLRTAAKERCYAKIGLFKQYIGIPKGILEQFTDRFIYVNNDNDYEMDEGVWLIPHKTEGRKARDKKARMYRKTENGMHVDDFQHEHSLVFDGSNGLVILNSCCHSGVQNIVAEVKETFPSKEIAAVIGGFHLMGLTGTNSMSLKADEVKALGQQLMRLGVKHIYTGHCTGYPAYRILKETLGDRVQYLSTGTIIEL